MATRFAEFGAGSVLNMGEIVSSWSSSKTWYPYDALKIRNGATG